MALTGKKILVTGGTGFIGSNLVNRLLYLGSDVIVPYQSIEPKSYFTSQGLHEKVLLANCDIKNFDRVYEIVTKYEIDYIFHLAAQPIVTVAYNNPLETYRTNVLGTVNVLEAARLYGNTMGILICSSDKAYGKLPRASEKNFVSGDHPYESSKAAADIIGRSYWHTYKLPVVVTRFGNVYGEGDLNFNRIIPGFMKASICNETLYVRSNGKFIRDYVYVEDIVDSMILIMKNIKKTNGEVFNVSSNENVSVLGVISSFEKFLGLKIKYKITSTAVNEIPVQSVDYNKIKKTLGWHPKKNFRTTSLPIYEWYKSYFN